MIPTKYKTKISKDHSFPVGAELLTSTLLSVPQLEKLKVSFCPMPIPNLKNNAQSILAAQYRNFQISLSSSNQFIAEGWYDETWELTVYAVPREQKYVIKHLLVDEGLQKLSSWLTTERSPAWRHGRKDFTILFSKATHTLSYSEDSTL